MKPRVTIQSGSDALAVPVATDASEYGPQYGPNYGGGGLAPAYNTYYDGEKFFGGFGPTEIQTPDYWTLRKRSAQLFNSNAYARGIIRRLVTNEINTGLMPESTPNELTLGVPEDSLSDWTDLVESRFEVWANTPEMCDWEGRRTWGEIQRDARREALVSGDVLVVVRVKAATKLPSIQLISGDHVRGALMADDTKLRKGHTIKHGVERDAQGRDVAFWVRQKDGNVKRMPARGEKSGRRIAWLVFGTDKRLDERRGQPLATIIMQSLREIDRYRDSSQRKAVINSMIAMYIKKTGDKLGTLPITGGATRKGTVTVDTPDSSKTTRTTAGIPGVVLEELQTGEEPVAFKSDGTQVEFGKFEEAVVAGMSWALETPPEIMRLAFSNNYSASQAAINEFRIYLNMRWQDFGANFCQPIYSEWLVSEALRRKIDAAGMIEAWRNPSQIDTFGAWVMAEWYGSIKPSTDMVKQTKASTNMIEQGFSTRARETRILTGMKFRNNARRLTRENEQLAEAKRPALELQAEYQVTGVEETTALDLEDTVAELVEEFLQDGN